MLQDQDQDRGTSVSSGLETKTAVSSTTRLDPRCTDQHRHRAGSVIYCDPRINTDLFGSSSIDSVYIACAVQVKVST